MTQDDRSPITDHGSPGRRRAVITGVGPITCAGIGVDAFWESILAGRSGISRITSFDTGDFKAHCGGEIREWDPTAFFPPHRLKRLDRYAQFSVASTLLARNDQGVSAGAAERTPSDPTPGFPRRNAP